MNKNCELSNVFKELFNKREYKDYEDFLNNGILISKKIPNDLKLFISLIRTGEILRNELEKFLKKFNISLSQKNVLDLLYSTNKEFLTQDEISKFLFTTKANVSNLLNNLEKKELIVREINKENKRKNKILITEKGKNLLKKIYASLKVSNFYFEDLLNSEDKLFMLNFLIKVRKKFQNESKE